MYRLHNRLQIYINIQMLYKHSNPKQLFSSVITSREKIKKQKSSFTQLKLIKVNELRYFFLL